MCEPVTMTAMAVASAAASYKQQKDAASMQREMQGRATEQERERAGKENTAIRARQSQQRDALAMEIEEGSRRANQARATATVASAESGITGRAADLVGQDVNVQHARHNQALIKQRAENDFSGELQTEEARMRNRSNLQRVNQPIKEADAFGAIMQGVSGVAGVQTQTANYTKATGQAPSFGGWADSMTSGIGGMLGINQQGVGSQTGTPPINNV